MKKLLTILFMLIQFLNYFAQAKKEKSHLFLKHTEVEHLELDCKTQDCEAFADNIALFKGLKSLELYNLESKKALKNLKHLKDLENLIIQDHIYRHFGIWFWTDKRSQKDVFRNKSLSSLVLIDFDMGLISKKLCDMDNLKSLVLENSNDLDVTGLYKKIALLSLDSLSISNSSCRSPIINKNTYRLGDLEYLKLENLYYFWRSGVLENIFYNKRSTASSYGSNLQTLETHHLDNIFEIENGMEYVQVFKPNQLITDNSKLQMGNYIAFSNMDNYVENAKMKPDTANEDWQTTKNNVNFGTFKMKAQGVYALSDAYQYYDSTLTNTFQPVYTDTTDFLDRFYDLRYTRKDLSKILVTDYESTGKKRRHFEKMDDEFLYIGFEKKKDKRYGEHLMLRKNKYPKKFFGKNDRLLSKYRSMYFPELTRFGYEKFKLVNGDPEELINQRWSDVIVSYDADSDVFVWKLKSNEKIQDYTFKILHNDSLRSTKKNQSIFKRYSKSFNRYNLKFDKKTDKKLYREKKQWLKHADKDIWRKPMTKYMSKKELRMTKEEWLEYYNGIIENEAEALYYGKVAEGTIKRALELKGFKEVFPYEWFRYYCEMTPKRVGFQIKDSTNVKPITIKRFYLIDDRSGNYVVFNSDAIFNGVFHKKRLIKNLSFGTFLIPNDSLNHRDMIFEYSDGSYAVINNIDFSPLKGGRAAQISVGDSNTMNSEGFILNNQGDSSIPVIELNPIDRDFCDIKLLFKKLGY